MLLLPISVLLVKMSDTEENGEKISLVIVVSSKSVAPPEKRRVTFVFYEVIPFVLSDFYFFNIERNILNILLRVMELKYIN